MRQTRWILPLILIAVCVASCGHKFDTSEDPSLEEIIAIGKGYLMEGNGASASEAFDAALKIDDQSTDARFGALIADDMAFVNLLDELISILGSLGTTSSAQSHDGRVVSAQSATFSDLLHEFLDDVLVGKTSQGEELYADLADESDFNFDLAHYQLQITTLTLVNFSGEFDKTDLHLFGAINGIFAGLLDFLLAHNLEIDLANLAIPATDPNASIVEVIDAYVQFIEDLISNPSSPDLLELDGPQGAEFMQETGIKLGEAFGRLGAAFDQLEEERDDQGDDQLWYYDENHDGRWDPATEYVAVGEEFSMDPELVYAVRVLAAELHTAFLDTSAEDVDPNNPNPFRLSALNPLLHYFDILPLVLLEDPFTLAITDIPDFLTVDIGPFFADPDADGVRRVIEDLVSLWNDLRGALGLEE